MEIPSLEQVEQLNNKLRLLMTTMIRENFSDEEIAHLFIMEENLELDTGLEELAKSLYPEEF